MGLNSGLPFTGLQQNPPLLKSSTNSPDQRGPNQRNNDRLDSWKEIANYLRREVRTVQLWEKNERMPVHRHFHKHLGSVFAFRSEIEQWRRNVSRIRGTESKQNLAEDNGPAKEHTTIRVLPIQNLCTLDQQIALCDAIFARTVSGLREMDPQRIDVSLGSTHAEQFRRESSSFPRSEYVLKWSIRDEVGELILDISLTSHGNATLLWGQTLRATPKSTDEAAAYVADQIVRCIWLKVTHLPKYSPASQKSEERTSREAYLKGRFFWKQRSEECLRKAVRCFESAIHLDPRSALPYSGLADALTLLSFYEFASAPEVMPSARHAALTAIELNPHLAEAHVSLADVLLHFDRDWQGADREYRRAIQCNPEYALGYHWYSNLLSARGQHDAARVAIATALEIDPVSIITLVWAGVTSYLARQFDDAITHYKKALELDPNYVWAHMYMAQALEQKGELRAALREFETALALANGNNGMKAMQAHTHAVAGDKMCAREILRQLKCKPADQVPSYDIAATYAALGEPNRMVAWLHRACRERSMKLFTLPQDPRFDAFRRHAEFKEIVQHIGLASA